MFPCCWENSGTSGEIGENYAESVRAGSLDPGAPPETRQFGQLEGDWDAGQASRNADGFRPGDTILADWIWRYTLDGHAI